MLKSVKILSLCTMFVLLAISTTFAAESKVDWAANYITVTGYGAAPATSTSTGQAMAMARRAAVVDGYRQMAEIINGVQVDSETTVKDLSVQSDIIKTKVSGIIRNARVVDEKQVGNGFEVTMTVPIFGVTGSGSVAETVLPKPEVKEPIPMPSTNVANTTPAGTQTIGSSAADPRGAADFKIQQEGVYTGVIIDCRGLGLKPAMSPVIKNAELESVYGYKNLDYDYVIAHGMAAYVQDINKATRAGSHPLVIKAEKMVGLGVNPVLSMKDSDKMLLENQATHFLDKTNVVFLY